jgi:hypothetical protein
MPFRPAQAQPPLQLQAQAPMPFRPPQPQPQFRQPIPSPPPVPAAAPVPWYKQMLLRPGDVKEAQAPAQPQQMGNFNRADPEKSIAIMNRKLQTIIQTANTTSKSNVLQKDVIDALKTTMGVVNDLSELVKMYADAFERTSAEIQKLSDAIGTDNTLETIKSLSDAAMKDAISRFESSMYSMDKYLVGSTKEDFKTILSKIKFMYNNVQEQR